MFDTPLHPIVVHLPEDIKKAVARSVPDGTAARIIISQVHRLEGSEQAGSHQQNLDRFSGMLHLAYGSNRTPTSQLNIHRPNSGWYFFAFQQNLGQ